MVSKVMIEKNAYHDSVTLMSLSGSISKTDGVKQAVVSMATQMNKELLENIGLMTEEANNASENDLIIAIDADSKEHMEAAFEKIEEELNAKKGGKKKNGETSAENTETALTFLPDANLAVISVPGTYAAREARKALNKNLNVMIFSDNVTIEEERELKELGRDKGLFVMGPDCGTAIINNVGLCFANKVRPGNIGLVGASGTGLQEVSVQIDRLGEGISQAIGVGGRDLQEPIGGIMMLEGMKALEKDENTKVIVLISKPPAASVQEKIMEQIKTMTKPVVVCFLDGDATDVEKVGASFAGTLRQGAVLAVQALGNSDKEWTNAISEKQTDWIKSQKEEINSSQKYIRGLFCGGTLTSEALTVIRPHVEAIKSNVAKRANEKLEDVHASSGNTLVDLGDDEFTQGKPHPMIEPSLRNERIIEEAEDPETAVLLLDFELGYGSHEDPVGVTVEALEEAQKIAKENGRHLPIIAYICGTSTDKQNYSEQARKLESLNVCIAESNEQAAEIAVKLI